VPSRADGANADGSSARNATTEFDTAISLKIEHGAAPLFFTSTNAGRPMIQINFGDFGPINFYPFKPITIAIFSWEDCQ
jgi:hypothetical protein